MLQEHVMVVEDDAAAAAIAATVCEQLGHRVSLSATVAEAVELLRVEEPSVVILDLALPDGDGVQVLHELRRCRPETEIILVSGFDDKVLGTVRQLAETLDLNVVEDLTKPYPVERLREALASAAALRRPIGAADLEEAIASEQIGLAYQPKVSLGARDFAVAPAVEALVRWRHPHHGDVPPVRLLALAEETGQIHALTWAVIDRALRQMQAWKAAGITPAVSINLAPQVLDDRRLPDQVSACAAQYGIDRSKLCFEITETAATAHTGLVLDIATRFRLQGMSLAIDDFGTGYSSLRQLYLLPFNELKIDISFVSEMLRREQARTLVKASIDLAHNLGMTACAEGVEDIETLSLLKEMGCDAAQGYFVSRPLVAERIGILVRGWRNPFSQ